MNPRNLRLSVLLAAASALTALTFLAPAPAQPATAQQPATAAQAKYLAADAIDLRALLPDPPTAGSALARGDIELVLAVQAEASDTTAARAVAEDKLSPWIFADALGPSFNADAKPRTAALLAQLQSEVRPISERAKALYDRPRPFAQDQHVTLKVAKPGNGSYPSGHAMLATAWSRVLAQLAPDKADALAARARLVGYDRIVIGVHFPSDIAAGIALGNTIADRLLADPAFRRDLDAVRAEWPAPTPTRP